MSDLVHLVLQVLPKYPLPTHDVVVRGGAPKAFYVSAVAKLRKDTKRSVIC
jgi:hypothetical protein